MSDATCKYNTTHGFFNRREIRMLAQALALPDERIEQRLNKLQKGDVIPTSELLNLIDNGTFLSDFYHMYNKHNGRYNCIVFSKAIKLIEGHLFSFNQILKARLAFDVYELNAVKDGTDNLQLILQTIKLCDYNISIIKLEQYLRHFHLNKTRLLHLCEYLDLLLMCIRDSNNNKNVNLLIRKKIDLADPKPIDQQIMEELNMKYLRDERNWFFEEIFSKEKFSESTVWPAKLVHQYQVEEASMSKAHLQRELSASISSLKQSRAGSACSNRSHSTSPKFRRSRPTSDCSFTSVTPIINGRSNNSSVLSNPMITTPDIQIKTNENSNYSEKIRADAAFLELKYAIHREDYMKELFPNGYSKPIIINKPVERPRVKKPKPPFYWLRRTMTAK